VERMASDPESFPKSNGVTEPKDSFLVRSLKDYILIIIFMDIESTQYNI
jgi:hypothetical protein